MICLKMHGSMGVTVAHVSRGFPLGVESALPDGMQPTGHSHG